MSPTRPSTDDRTDQRETVTVRVSRELDAAGAGADVRLTLHPCTRGEPPRGSLVDEETCTRLTRAVLDAFDAERLSDLRTVGSDRFERNICLGTAVISDESLTFERNDALDSPRRAVVR